MDKHVDANISRRTFLRAGLSSLVLNGALSVLPKVEGGYLFPVGVNTALASESQNVTEGTFNYNFHVLTADEVGVHVIDVTSVDDAGNYAPVNGAKVTIYSNEDNSPGSVEGVTGSDGEDDGKVILNIASLVPKDSDGKPKYGSNKFNASITIVNANNTQLKMCDFHIPNDLIEGGNGYVINTRPYKDDPYIYTASFNSQDIMTKKRNFTRSKNNNAAHTIQVGIKNVDASADIKVTLDVYLASDTDRKTPMIPELKQDATKEGQPDGAALATFSKNFLERKDDNKYLLPEGDLVIVVKVIRDNLFICYKDLYINTSDAKLDDYGYDGKLSPFPATNPTCLGFSCEDMSQGPHWLAGQNLSLLTTLIPLQVAFTPSYCILGIDLGQLFSFKLPGLESDDGDHIDQPGPTEAESPRSPWRRDSIANIDEWKAGYNRKYEQFTQLIEDQAQPFLAKDGTPASFTRGGFISVNLVINPIGKLQWSGFENNELLSAEPKEKITFVGTFMMIAGLSAQGSYTFQFMAGPVPMYFCVTVGLTITYNFTTQDTYATKVKSDGTVSTDINDRQKLSKSTHACHIVFTFAVSAGVGVAGVASIGLSATLCVDTNFIWNEAGFEDKEQPHRIVTLVFKGEVVFQFFVFKYSLIIYSYRKGFDNWEKKGLLFEHVGMDAWQNSSSRFLLTHKDGRKRYTAIMENENALLMGNEEDLLADAVKVSDDDLLQSEEAVGTQNDDDDALPVARLRTTLQRNMEPCVTVQEDGTIVTSLVEATYGVNTFLVEPLTAGDEVDEQGQDVAEEELVGLQLQGEGGGEQTTADDQQYDVTETPEVEVATATQPTSPAQSATEHDSNLYGDYYLGFADPVSTPFKYEYTGKATGSYCGMGGVSGIARHGGIVPEVDAPIFKGVYSNARQKVIEIAGELYLFRISSVTYQFFGESLSRTRLTASRFDNDTRTWGESEVIEYGTDDPNLDRLDLLDHDFDVIAAPQGEPWSGAYAACVVVVGSVANDSDSFYDTLANQTITLLLVDGELNVLHRMVKRADNYLHDKIDGVHALQKPRIVDGFAAGAASGALGIVLIDRVAADAKDALGPLATPYLVIGSCFVRDGMLSISFAASSDMVLDASVSDAVVSAGSDASGGVLRMIFRRQSGYEAWSALIPNGSGAGNMVVRRNVVSEESLPSAIEWPYHGRFLITKGRSDIPPTTNDYHLYALGFDVDDTGQTGLTEECVDRGAIKGSQITVSPSGNFLFYFEQYVEDPSIVPPVVDVEETSGNQPEGSYYRIAASMLIDGKFSEDFPFAELDHPIDHFECVAGNYHAASVFTTLEITNADKSLADINYLVVPYNISAEATALSVIDFAMSGKPCEFQVDVVNHGNMIITAFTINLCDDQDKDNPLSARIGEIKPENVLLTASSYNWAEALKVNGVENELSELSAMEKSVEAAKGLIRLSAEEQGGWLMPGKKLSYKITLDIPANWSGDRTGTITISDADTIMVNEIHEAAIIHECYHPGVQGSFTLVADGVTGTDNFYYTEEYYPDEPTPDPGPTPGPTPTPSPSPGQGGSATLGGGSGTSRRLPDTGDLAGVMGPVGLALGGMGSLLAAYSARRTEIEREEHGREERDEWEG